MVWPLFSNRTRKASDVRPPVSDDDRRLIAEALAAGRVTVCPTRSAPIIASSTIGRSDTIQIAADILRVERAG